MVGAAAEAAAAMAAAAGPGGVEGMKPLPPGPSIPSLPPTQISAHPGLQVEHPFRPTRRGALNRTGGPIGSLLRHLTPQKIGSEKNPAEKKMSTTARIEAQPPRAQKKGVPPMVL